MNVKHTPGPWTLNKMGEWPQNAPVVRATIDGTNYEIAKIFGPLRGLEETAEAAEIYANARLFVAAPDMFKALTAIDHFLWKEGYTTTSPEIAQVCAAITKAEETQ